MPTTMDLTPGGRTWWPRWRPGVLAWTLWALSILGLTAVFWLDQRLRHAGRSELVYLGAENLPAAVAAISAATVGTVLSGRRPAHPVGWLLVGLGLVVPAAGIVLGYTRYGIMAQPGALPARSSRCWAANSP